MSVQAPVNQMSVEVYLSNPEYEHHEYVDGEAIELNMGTGPHSLIQASCCAALKPFLKILGRGQVLVEYRCRLHYGGHVRFRLHRCDPNRTLRPIR